MTLKRQIMMGLVLAASISAGGIAFADSRDDKIVLAQSDASYRVVQLEEQVRQLNGRIEELNFQLLQLQETLRKMQEDNEFRFQELEERGDANSKPDRKTIGDLIDPSSVPGGETAPGKPMPSEQSADAGRSGGETTGASRPRKTIDGVEIYEGPSGQDNREAGTLGQLTFDADGNLITPPEGGEPIDLTKRFNGSNDDASGQLPDDPDALYTIGYDYIQSGDYELAQNAFETFVQKYPDHPKSSDVHFWLGESYFARSRFDDAAEVFLDAHKRWPEARLAPQTLLKLGVSLASLNQRELACATYAEVKQKYPQASPVVMKSVAAEQKAAKCIN